MSTLRTTTVFPDHTGSVSGQYDAYNIQADGVDVIRAEHINSTFNSIQKTQSILLDGYALNNIKLHDGYALTTLTGFDLNLSPASGKDAYVTSGSFHVTSGNLIADSGSAVLKLQSKTFDPTGVQDGQTLVYNQTTSTFVAGASGDASFKIQSVTTPNAVLKSGYIILDDGRELNLASDTTMSLTTILGASPANATSYYLYVDLSTLPAATTVSGRKIYAIVSTNFALLTTTPEATQLSRYVPIGQILSATSGNAWSGTGSAFSTLAFRRHSKAAVAASPIVYTLTGITAASYPAGTKITHNANTAKGNQIWTAQQQFSDGYVNQLDTSWIINIQDSNTIEVDFSFLGGSDTASIVLESTALSPTTIPTKVFDTGYVAANTLSFPLTHGLSGIPTSMVLQHAVTSGEYENLDPASYISATNTIINGTLTALGSDIVRIVASAAPDAVSVFTGFVSISSGGYTASNGDQILADTTTGSFTINLPATPAVGYRVIFYDAARQFDVRNLVIGRNGSNIEGSASDLNADVQGDKLELIYVSASAGWRVY